MFFKGLLIGFAIAVPVGPIGFLCLRRTLIYGRLTGFISGLGAATADAFYGLGAAFGLSAVSTFLIRHGTWLQLGGGAFLLILGFKTASAKPPAETVDATHPTPPRQRAHIAAFASTFALTLASPATVLAFVAIFTGVGLGLSTNGMMLGALELVGGVFAGSALWWLLLATVAGLLRERLHARSLHVLHVASGIGIMTLGGWQLSTVVADWLT